MAQQFYTLLTNIGKAKLANANVFGKKINLTTLVVGDGNGNYYNPTEDQEHLTNEVWRGNIQLITVDEQNPNWIKIETVIPSNVGGFTIREVGGLDDEGNLILIAKYPETYKPIIDDGATKELRIKIILEVSNTENVTLKVNPNVITATKEDIENLKNKINNLDGKAVTLRSYSKLEKDTKIIPIGIQEFNPFNEDDLEVHMNGRLLTKDVNYKIASSDTEIENIDEEILWQTGDEFDIALHKNIKNKVEHIDVGLIPEGSITEDKLNPQIVEKVKEVSDKLPKSDFDNFRKDYVSNNGFAKTTGTSTIYNVTLNPAPTSYVDGLNVTIIPHVDCGDNPKLNVNGLGVTTILKQDGSDIKAGEIKANKPLSLVRVGSNFFMKSSIGKTFYNEIKNLQSGTKVELININREYDVVTAIPLNVYKDEETYHKVLTSETELNYKYESGDVYWYLIINGTRQSLMSTRTSSYASIRPVFLYIERSGTKAKLRFSFAVYDKPGVVGASEYLGYFEYEFNYTPNTIVAIETSWSNAIIPKNYLRIVAWKNS
ncbi:phage tail protein [Clostridium senegalense]|uniref:phage tail protein n=1 Tax=Clostridium senegalense TaxID=1465809 RepID=UPI000288C82D|nr:phage tail protein [Clostridium senegalense]